MLRNYLKLALRHLARHRGYAALNIAGLAIGLACALLIFAYVRFELSFDVFHDGADRIYRVLTDAKFFGEHRVSPASSAHTGRAMVRELPEVVSATRMNMRGPEMLTHDGQVFTELKGGHAGASFFEVFSFPLATGNPETVLRRPNSAVLTRSTAEKIFGDENPLGETISVPITSFGKEHLFTITGIAEDPPANSHFGFDFLVSFSTYQHTVSRQGPINSVPISSFGRARTSRI